MSTRSSLGLTARHRVLGVAFLALLLLFVWFTTAVFTKKFVDYVPVRLTSSSIGLQLPALADVKIRGLLVGDVRSVSSNGPDTDSKAASLSSSANTANFSARAPPTTGSCSNRSAAAGLETTKA